ncbi:CHAD domain-containing protein [Streptomyces sp. NPDC048650]|uniref:CHAD domain-containing protein n=1 Tax=unclassified Streptomyces TaxID=2593676 RepID=UPI003716240E
MTRGGAGVAQRHDQSAGGTSGLIGIGYDLGGVPGARAAVVDGPEGSLFDPYGDAGPGTPGAPGDRANTGDTGDMEDGESPAGSGEPVGTAQPPDSGGTAGPALSGRTSGEVLSGYLHRRAADFLRSLRLHRESGSDAQGAGEAAGLLRGAARRISATLYTFQPLTDETWADQLRAELGWLSGTLAREHACAARRERLMTALQRLTSPAAGAPAPDPDAESALSVGAARAGALLDRQLTLARTRAHSAALQALGSSRFHAVADSVAVLASEAQLARAVAEVPAAEALPQLVEGAHRRLAEAVSALPLSRAGHPYNADALTADHRQDAPWHQVRMLVRLSRYAQEVIAPGYDDPRLAGADRALERHRDAAEAATAAAGAARTPRIAPATAYALGVLHADQRHEVEAARFAFGRAWLPHAGGGAAHG